MLIRVESAAMLKLNAEAHTPSSDGFTTSGPKASIASLYLLSKGRCWVTLKQRTAFPENRQRQLARLVSTAPHN